MWGPEKQQQIENEMKKWDEIGQMLVSGALDDTKTIGKAGADIFANFGAETPFQMFPHLFPHFSVDFA